jgi:hypothetical protein
MSDNPYKLRFEIWQEAKQGLLDQYFADNELWTNWQFADNHMMGECPIESRPVFPTNEDIRTEAEKIYSFVQTKS